jgi:hypothetical protein
MRQRLDVLGKLAAASSSQGLREVGFGLFPFTDLAMAPGAIPPTGSQQFK